MSHATSDHTGPRNALRQGLTSKIAVMPSGDLQAYQSHLKSFVDEYHPKGATEAQLVRALGDVSWRLNQVPALEVKLLTLADSFASLERRSKALANLSLHSLSLSGHFGRIVAQLRKRDIE
jgi:hypothetical protein